MPTLFASQTKCLAAAILAIAPERLARFSNVDAPIVIL
jgi:hypothetical protein